MNTPEKIKETAIKAIMENKTHYTTNRGLIELRKEVCNYYDKKYNAKYNPETEAIITTGGSEGIDISLRAIINQGDEIIVTDPGYVAYKPLIQMAGGIPKPILLSKENQFKLTPEALKSAITSKTKTILINYPSNPTGAIMTKEDYEKIIPIIKESGILVISDEIYADLSYESEFCSVASFEEIKDQCIIVSGFSKNFAMTGWRLGYVLANKEISNSMYKIHQYATMSASSISQYAALEGLRNCLEDVEIMRQTYLERRNFCVKTFNELGLETFMPQGAFYVFVCIKNTGMTSEEFCKKLLEEQKVACIPGNAFGPAGEGYIRVSYAYSMEQLKEATEKIKIFLNR